MKDNDRDEGSTDPGEPEQPEKPGEQPPEQRVFANRLTVTLIIFELAVGIIGLIGGHLFGVQWSYFFRFEMEAISLGVVTGAAIFGFNALVLFSWVEHNPFYRWVYEPFARALLKPLQMLSIEDIIFISILSGVAEELLFRGWLLASFDNHWVGLVVSSVVFGVIHIWSRQGIGYGVYATGMGFVLGLLFIFTGVIWAPILAHGVNNLFSMISMKYGLTPSPPSSK